MCAEASSFTVVTVLLLALSSPTTQSPQHTRHLQMSLGISNSRFIQLNGRRSDNVDVSEF